VRVCGVQATSGEPGDCENFSEFVKANLKLYQLKHAASLTTHAAANYTRGELATALRKARPRHALRQP
jgi:20S proteasome subunit beta 4